METVKVVKGQIVIPQSFVKKLKIKKGQTFVVQETNGNIVLIPVENILKEIIKQKK